MPCDARSLVCLLVFASAACSKPLTSEQARRKADAFVGVQYGMRDISIFDVRESEKIDRWEITYSGKPGDVGGDTVVGVDKRTRQARFLGSTQ